VAERTKPRGMAGEREAKMGEDQDGATGRQEFCRACYRLCQQTPANASRPCASSGGAR
jgi:hypothetical protein